MAHFDFHSYLTSKLPSHLQTQIAVQPLQGGFTNLAVWANFQPPVKYESHILESVILKYASSPTQPLSVGRQTIEAEALRILGGSGVIPAIPELLRKYAGRVRIPHLVHHDMEQNVLWICDLGETIYLSEYLTSTPPPSSSDVKGLATTLGSLLSELFAGTRDPAPDTIALLGHPHAGDAVELVGGLAKEVLIHSGITDAEVLAARVEEALRDNGRQEQCVGICDLWPGSILIDPVGRCGLIDWEYFGLSNAASEVGMFFAHLHIFTIIHRSSKTVAAVLQLFISEFLRSFVAGLPAPSTYFKHRVLITHGRELVINFDLYSDKINDVAKDTMIQASAHSLRAAGRTEADIDLSILRLNDGLRIWSDLATLFSLPV